jgi:two-component system nitrate/nitrite response regulator NarL
MDEKSILLLLEPGLFKERLANLLAELDGGCRVLETHDASLSALRERDLAGVSLIVVDIDRIGAETAAQLAAHAVRAPTVPVAGFGASENREDIDRSMAAGLAGYVPKRFGSSDTLLAFALILSGEIYRPDANLVSPPREVHAPRHSAAGARAEFGLTDAEAEVLALLARGKTNREIAHARGTQPSTVRIQLTPIFRKLGVQSRTQAIVVALRHGLLHGPPATQRVHQPLDLAWLLPHMKHRRHRCGHVVFRRGDVGKEMFLIQRGRVAISDIDVELKEHDVFGEIGVFTPDHRRTNSATCTTDVDLWALPEDKARHLCITDPTFALRMLDLVASRLSADRMRAA